MFASVGHVQERLGRRAAFPHCQVRDTGLPCHVKVGTEKTPISFLFSYLEKIESSPPNCYYIAQLPKAMRWLTQEVT